MSNYRILLFDVDDTLLDFGAAEKTALQLLFANQQLVLTEEIAASYRIINKELWRAFEEGKIEREEVLNTRFARLFKEMGIEADGVLLERKYREYLQEGHVRMEGAYELLSSLQKDYQLYVVTNGVSNTQDKRLRDSGLYPFFQSVFVSETAGYQKPMKEFFDYVFARIPHFSKASTLIIGDSLSSDIQGGQLAGIDTCWYNPFQHSNHMPHKPTYEIQKLEQLHEVLKKTTVYETR